MRRAAQSLWKLIIPELRALVLTKRHVGSGNEIAKGRTFVNGCALSQDLRKLIVDEIVRNGGISTQATFQANFHMWKTLLK